MEEESVRCPICGTLNEGGDGVCRVCNTILAQEDGGKVKVSSPKPRGRIITMIDIEDPVTRKKLEELTLIPGVTRKKALLLYQSGIHSIEDFLRKAFRGERFSENYSRTVANKLLLESIRGRARTVDIPCPSCGAPNPADAKTCGVCNYEIKKGMDSIDLDSLGEEMAESISGMMDELSQDENFDALPEDLKLQFAAALEMDAEEIETDVSEEMKMLGLEAGPKDAVDTWDTGDIEDTGGTGKDAREHDRGTERGGGAGKGPAGGTDKKKEKVRALLMDKMEAWRKAGYDVTGLDAFLDDVDAFKQKAKECLGRGKVVRARYKKQLDMWVEKGFDVHELEPLLDTDVVAFMRRAKEVLRKQKDKM